MKLTFRKEIRFSTTFFEFVLNAFLVASFVKHFVIETSEAATGGVL